VELQRLQALNQGLERTKADQATAAYLAAEKLRAMNQELESHKGERDAALSLVERMRAANRQLELDKAERDAALATHEQELAQLRKLFDKPENWLLPDQNSVKPSEPAIHEQPQPLAAAASTTDRSDDAVKLC
jgi:hypothetical protein